MYKNIFWISLCFFMFTANVYAMEEEEEKQENKEELQVPTPEEKIKEWTKLNSMLSEDCARIFYFKYFMPNLLREHLQKLDPNLVSFIQYNLSLDNTTKSYKLECGNAMKKYDPKLDAATKNFETFFSHVCHILTTGEKNIDIINMIGIKNEKPIPSDVKKKLEPFAKALDFPILILSINEPQKGNTFTPTMYDPRTGQWLEQDIIYHNPIKNIIHNLIRWFGEKITEDTYE